MDVAELRALFEAEGVDPDRYWLDGGTPNEAYVLERMSSGWDVYYAERGLRTAQDVGPARSDDSASSLSALLVTAILDAGPVDGLAPAIGVAGEHVSRP